MKYYANVKNDRFPLWLFWRHFRIVGVGYDKFLIPWDRIYG